MSQNKMQLLAFKGIISEQSEEDQKKIFDLAEEFRVKLRENPEFGTTSMALVGLEMQVEDEL
jgi:hypothetical protein